MTDPVTAVDKRSGSPPSGRSTRASLHLYPRQGIGFADFAELWGYRELLWFFAVRDIKVRYKQTVLGALWAILQPLLTMVVFSIFFGYLAGIDHRIPSGIPYPIYTFCALLPWQMFSQALTSSGNSLVDSQNLISKVYFPRLLIPASAVAAGIVDFAIALAVLLGLMIFYRVYPGWEALFIPLMVAAAILTALSVGIWISALSAMYRDFRYTLGFLAQFWLLITPVAYPSSLVPEPWTLLYGLNPMTAVVDGFRWSLLGEPSPAPLLIYSSLAVVLVLFVTGIYFFRKMERTMADWI